MAARSRRAPRTLQRTGSLPSMLSVRIRNARTSTIIHQTNGSRSDVWDRNPAAFRSCRLGSARRGRAWRLSGRRHEALSEAGIYPDWIAGMSIGATNAAIIAGNPPRARVGRLREFWSEVTSDGWWPDRGDARLAFARADNWRNLLNQMSAGRALATGAKGFFKA
jgi:hypothetical protein